MYRVDLGDFATPSEFGYINKKNVIEKVTIDELRKDSVFVVSEGDSELYFKTNIEDIPNLIKALQMAYDTSGKKKIDSGK